MCHYFDFACVPAASVGFTKRWVNRTDTAISRTWAVVPRHRRQELGTHKGWEPEPCVIQAGTIKGFIRLQKASIWFWILSLPKSLPKQLQLNDSFRDKTRMIQPSFGRKWCWWCSWCWSPRTTMDRRQIMVIMIMTTKMIVMTTICIYIYIYAYIIVLLR